MKTEDILTIEEAAENRINLVRDRLGRLAKRQAADGFRSKLRLAYRQPYEPAFRECLP